MNREKLKTLKAHCAFLWSFVIRARVGFRCELHQKDHLKCGNEIQAAHIVMKSIAPRTRYDLRNGRSICSVHHKYYTHRPEFWAQMCMRLWPEDWKHVTSDEWMGVKNSDNLDEIFQFLWEEALQYDTERKRMQNGFDSITSWYTENYDDINKKAGPSHE